MARQERMKGEEVGRKGGDGRKGGREGGAERGDRGRQGNLWLLMHE